MSSEHGSHGGLNVVEASKNALSKIGRVTGHIGQTIAEQPWTIGGGIASAVGILTQNPLFFVPQGIGLIQKWRAGLKDKGAGEIGANLAAEAALPASIAMGALSVAAGIPFDPTVITGIYGAGVGLSLAAKRQPSAAAAAHH